MGRKADATHTSEGKRGIGKLTGTCTTPPLGRRDGRTELGDKGISQPGTGDFQTLPRAEEQGGLRGHTSEQLGGSMN